uniref:C2H2-type domain-containing protein n=1 Tax=Branchiostoma floridae TaxID=7739 RepID=C3YF24_BRAFL|eukprot:XP_002605016.1 hypothetical protein BRAFLDRAFT_85156 [Branchiostoma floridae]
MANSPRQDLYLEISRNLEDQELTDLRNYVCGTKILPARFVQKADAHQIFNQLEKKQKLKPGDISFLTNLLRNIDRDDYAEKAEKIAENERKELNEKPNSTASQPRRRLSPTVSDDDDDDDVSGPKAKVRREAEAEPPILHIVVRIVDRVQDSVKTPKEARQWASAKKTLYTTAIKRDDTRNILKKIEPEVKTVPDLMEVVKTVKELESLGGIVVPNVTFGSLVFHLRCTDLVGLGKLWFMYKHGELDKLMHGCLTREETLQQLSAENITVKATIEAEEFRNALAYILNIPAAKGLDSTTSADLMLDLPPVDHSNITGLDLAVVSKENQSCTGLTDDISTLNLTVRQVQKALQSCKEKKDVRLETIRGQVRTAREDTEAMVRSQTRAIIGLREKDEKAQKILLEQKMEISQLQESIKPREAEIEALTAENTKLSNQVADIPELRDEVRKLKEKDETSQNVLSELRQEMQQLQSTIKTREAKIEELTAENTKLSKQVAEGHDQLERLREKEETPLKALSEQEQETQQLLETYKGNAAAQTEDQGSAKHTVEEKSQGEELMLEETQSGAEDKGQGTELEVEPNLSREVSLAVLPRLNKEELRRELEDRKDITVTTEGSQDKLMKRLCDEMVKEYSDQLASSTSLGSSTRNRPMQDASTQREETNEAAPIKVAHSGPTGTADTEPMLRATIGAKGIDDAGAGKQRDSQEMQDAVRLRVRPSMTESQNPGSWDAAGPSSIAIAKRTREQETKFGPSTPLKRSKTGEETTRKDVTMNVATTSGNTRAAEATTAKTVLSPNFATPKSGIVTGAGPGSIAIPGMPSPQRAGNNLTCPCGYKARSKSDLQQHAVQTRHKPFQCENSKCSFKTSYYQSLKKHQRTHEKKVDFISSFPGRGFHY